MTQEELKKIAEESWEGCDGCTETDKQMYINGFIKGFNLSESPYCKVCSACGEEGCCSPMVCKQSPDGDYCQTYLKDLKFKYKVMVWFEDNIYHKMPKELQAEYDLTWDKMWDEIYNQINNE